MDLGLKDKVAVVAGSSRGIGYAVAEALAREGCRVVVNSRDATRAREAADQIRRNTRADVRGVAADVADPQGAAALVEAALRATGTVHILVTNAGGPPSGFFPDLKLADFEAALRLNLLSTIALIQAALPAMKKQRWGRILNVTSVSVKQPLDNLILSNVSRPGVLGLSRTLAGQLAAEGITINTLCPGYTATERVESLLGERSQKEGKPVDELRKSLAANIPAGRLGDPKELAALAAFLASDQAAYVTGQVVAVDGGFLKGII